MRSIGLRGKPGELGACLHDLRHTFAVRSLEQCNGTSIEVSRHVTALSTYMGHADASDTYWYLQAPPLLMAQISGFQEA
ncbi:MAG: integrase [Arenicella sp.]|jgi:integrase